MSLDTPAEQSPGSWLLSPAVIQARDAILAEQALRDREGKLSVILPAYNEAARIFDNVLQTAEALNEVDHEIIVVDDGSADGTYEEAMRAALVLNSNRGPGGRNPRLPGELSQSFVKVVRYEVNRGKGHALRYGFSHSSGDLVAFLDADLDLPPVQVNRLRQVMQETGADVVIGSKRHPETQLDYPWPRKIISSAYYALVHLLFSLPIHDSQTGLKLYRREVLERVMPRMRVQRFAHDLEILVGAHRFGYSIVEAPVVITYGRDRARPLAVARASISVALDTIRVFYWASFWKWLSPSASTKLWIIALLAGVSALSFGIAGFLTRAGVPHALGDVADIVFLRFLAQPIRDALLVAAGIGALGASCLELNKHIARAFARMDQGGLAGIPNVRGTPPRNGLKKELATPELDLLSNESVDA